MGQEQVIKGERNYGIDMLRILAMLYVVVLHCLGLGGVLVNCEGNTTQHTVAWFMETWTYCAVDMFAIISGFVGYSDAPKKVKASSYIMMWLQVVFYGVVVTLITYFINPQLVTMQDLVSMFFPVTKSLYWYFTAYTGLFLVMPLLNTAVRCCSKKQLKRLFIALFVFFICVETVFPISGTGNGYSFVWLVLMYLMGAIMKKCEIGKNIKPLAAFAGIAVLIVISCGWKLYGEHIDVLGKTLIRDFLISYTSPTIVGSAILYVIGASKMKFPKWAKKVIGFLAPGTFAVYILNNQRFISANIMSGKFAHLSSSPVWRLVGEILIFSLVFVLVSILFDRLRDLIFRLCHVRQIVEKFTAAVDRLLRKLNI